MMTTTDTGKTMTTTDTIGTTNHKTIHNHNTFLNLPLISPRTATPTSTERNTVAAILGIEIMKATVITTDTTIATDTDLIKHIIHHTNQP